MKISLEGKTAIVTGASQGLGAATAATLHAAGANVIVNYFDDAEGTNRSNAHTITRQLGARSLAVAADVRDRSKLASLLDQTMETFSGLDIVVNNAGIVRDRTLQKMSADHWQQVIDTNLTGVFNVSQLSAEVMRAGGSIVSVSSIAAAVGSFGQANYASAKAGVNGFTKVLSRELARRSIRVNAVAPGVVQTEMVETIPKAIRDQMLTQVPLARFGQPEEIANVILFLCSDLASYITGQTIHVNGGWWGP